MSTPYPDASTTEAPTPPTFVGLDLSLTSTGIAIIRSDQITVRRVTSKGRKDATYAEKAERLAAHIDAIVHEIPTGAATHVAVEGPSFASTGSAAHILGGLWWGVRLELLHTDVTVVSPSTVKKYATGKGNAGKDEVLAAVVRRYPQVAVTGNDEADALVLAAIAARIGGWPIDINLPVAQVQAALAVKR